MLLGCREVLRRFLLILKNEWLGWRMTDREMDGRHKMAAKRLQCDTMVWEVDPGQSAQKGDVQERGFMIFWVMLQILSGWFLSFEAFFTESYAGRK